MSAVFVPGRPFWARDETVGVQRLVVAHKLNATQLKALREFIGSPDAPRILMHSTARALRSRGLGEITSKQMNSRTTRDHPRAQFLLTDHGRELVAALAEADPGFVAEQVGENLAKVTITRAGNFQIAGPLRLADEGAADASPEGRAG
jgi:hypothetical protein